MSKRIAANHADGGVTMDDDDAASPNRTSNCGRSSNASGTLPALSMNNVSKMEERMA
eukprot:CAMPEP_0119570014 /NCGR_PEP_ID=MMETSP1352-20130426/43277_1 /TAXON_ID=265584 /ORGANISM="Stauroneis constricta, Strain CCMP1120" /LENGTH=56 /DNA_ID=CAMNT_0007619673 /DNA_START=83 /DNA_END=249 /DNA_ORIENTATION=-